MNFSPLHEFLYVRTFDTFTSLKNSKDNCFPLLISEHLTLAIIKGGSKNIILDISGTSG